MRGKRQFDGPVSRILVSMGMTDHPNVTTKVLSALSIARLDAEIDVVLGAGAPHLDAVRQAIADMPQKVSLKLNVEAFADLLQGVDFPCLQQA